MQENCTLPEESADWEEQGYQAMQLVNNVQEWCGACLSLHPCTDPFSTLNTNTLWV